jgi:hypothetical protein
MGWIRVSDDFYDNDKFGEVGPLGVALHLAALGFCNRKLSDGYFKKNKARLLLDFDGISITTFQGEMCSGGVDGDDAAKLVIEWMVAADLWHPYGHDCDSCHDRADGGEPAANEYLIHDYLKFQPSRAEVEAKLEANRKRVEAWRQSHKGGGNGVGNSVTNGEHTQALTQHVQAIPNPNPNPSSSLVTSSGGVASVDARGPRPHCAKHPNENSEESCRPCKRRREWDEKHEALVQADELDRKRTAKAAASVALRDCLLCDEGGWVLGPDNKPIEPAVKCTHQEQAHA